MSLLKAMLMGGISPQYNFIPVIYTGTGSEQSITGLPWQPDCVWIKSRSLAHDHKLFDSVRGATNSLITNKTDQEDTINASLSSFDSNGFTIGDHVTVNQSGVTYIAWCWKADNTSGSSNTNGSITSTVSAGEGFSIVKYQGNLTSGATVGHGLPTTPKMVIVKQLSGAGNWFVNITGNDGKTMYLNLTNGFNVSTPIWNDTDPTDTVFTLGNGNTNSNNEDYIAYCFADIPGIQKIGSYAGTGVVGLNITTDFQPIYVMIKRTDAVGSWQIFDTVRDSVNPISYRLQANANNTEGTSATVQIAINATGFSLEATHGDINSGSGTYIYMAFAEQP